MKEYWNNFFHDFDKASYDGWLDEFEDIIKNTDTAILDLGCGNGNNLMHLVNKKKKVIACDISLEALNNIKNNCDGEYDVKCFDMLDGLPFEDNYFQLVIADLSLHYFRHDDTLRIIDDIKRVLRSNGYLIIRVNSLKDINYGAGNGEEVEKHLYKTSDNRLKRFFDEEDIRDFFSCFSILSIKEEIMTRYGEDKIVYKVCLKKTN